MLITVNNFQGRRHKNYSLNPRIVDPQQHWDPRFPLFMLCSGLGLGIKKKMSINERCRNSANIALFLFFLWFFFPSLFFLDSFWWYETWSDLVLSLNPPPKKKQVFHHSHRFLIFNKITKRKTKVYC